MATSREEECSAFLMKNGLIDPKWSAIFCKLNIANQDDILAIEDKEEIYQTLVLEANPTELTFLKSLFKIVDSPMTAIDKVHIALEEVGLDVVYWSRVLALQAGVITAQAIEYVQYDFYPHLVQFARFPAEKRALRKLLNIENEEENLNERYDNVKKVFELRKSYCLEVVKKMKAFQNEGKDYNDPEVQEKRQRILESLQVPNEFWFSNTTYDSFTYQIESFYEEMTTVFEKNEVLEDSLVLQNASAGLALKGVYIQSKENIQDRSVVVKVPEDIVFQAPFLFQYVQSKSCVGKEEEKRVIRKNILAKEALKFKSDDEDPGNSYCSTIKFFVVPVASCLFKMAQLKLSDEVVERIKKIDESGACDLLSAQVECERIFDEFGSHICLGPFHFGGLYMWHCYSSEVEEPDFPAAHALQKEAINKHGMISKPPSCPVPVNETHIIDAKYSEQLIQKTLIDVSTIGGPEGTASVAIWRNRLMAENKSWVLLDRGTEYIPIWEIAKIAHAHELQNVSHLAQTMKEVWEKKNAQHKKHVMQDVYADVDELTKVVTIWNDSEELTNCEDKLSFLLKKKQEVTKEVMDLSIWPTYYLSSSQLQTFLKKVVDACSQNDSTQSLALRSFLRQVVGPTDLESVCYFSERDYFRKWVFETERPIALLGCDDLMIMAEWFKTASESFSTHGVSSELSSDDITYPQTSFEATAVMTRIISYLRNHISKTEQVYDDIFIVTLLYPFNFEVESNVFLSCLTLSDMSSLSKQFEEHTKRFFLVKEQNDTMKLQAHLILLTIDMYQHWDVTTSRVKSHFRYIAEMMPDDVDFEIKDILTKLVNVFNMEWAKTRLQYILHGVSTNENNSSLEKLLATEEVNEDTSSLERLLPTEKVNEATVAKLESSLNGKKEHNDIFSLLKLFRFYPQKMTLHDALEVREDTLDITSCKEVQCSDPELYPFLILQKIMSFDCRCRIKLACPSNSPNLSAERDTPDDSGSSDSDTESESEDIYVHPLDGLLALLHCADNFLRQDLLCRLATCQIALPLVLPNPLTEELTYILWAMRTIVKQWKSDNGKISHEIPIVSYRSPIISFLRFGLHQRSKSHMINVIINNGSLDTFFHYNCDGGSVKQTMVAGLVEIAWYFPSTTNSTFKDAVTFTNMHGDARKFQRQVDFLSEVSFMSFVFLNEEDLDEAGFQVLQTMSKAPGGLVLLRTRSAADSKLWHEKYKHLKKRIPKESCSVIKMDKKNEADIKDDIRARIVSSIERQWNTEHKTHPTLEECSDLAIKCGIRVDENENECTKGKQLAYGLKSIIAAFILEYPNESPKKMLPLQGTTLWHEWASLDKEQYRHKNRGKQSIEEYTLELRDKMSDIRSIQLSQAQSLSPLMQSFLTSLLSYGGKTRRYYLQWIKMILDDLSREMLPPLHRKYEKKRKDLRALQQAKVKDNAAINKCKRELEKININLIYASMGLEHLFREIGQVYEAIASKSATSKLLKSHLIRLPFVAAELLLEGYPLELMDGDAAHVPITWVSAVLEQVENILKDPPILALSILGLQSTGKSTLLNTLFGVHFNVSAGRCTRGAFMQLVPFHKSLREECKCSYFLLVDTEGLRAPELDAMQTQNHDNQLATFVIGLGNLTVINIYGETPGDLDDILQTSVHAFLRMKAVKLAPGCHFVHQNVTAVMAGEKGVMGRFKFKEKLDLMTIAAAKEEHLDEEYNSFSDVIRFNDEKDVSHFPSLWNGNPPMAPVNAAYSFKARTLKSSLVDFAREMQKSHHIIKFSFLKTFLSQFWKAVLYENFVFNFKNTLESSTYSTLEKEYSTWSWSFQKDMIAWEHALKNRVSSCTGDENPRDVYVKERDELLSKGNKKYQTLQGDLAKFFNERPDKEILIKWKVETESRLRHLREQLLKHAENHCEQVWKSKQAEDKLKNIKSNHRMVIVEEVKRLVEDSHSETEKLSDKELEKRFEQQWKIWVKELEKVSVDTQVHETDIKTAVQMSLRQHFKASDSLLIQKQDPSTGKPLEQWGEALSMVPQSKHVKLLQGVVHYLSSKVGLSSKIQWKPLAEKETADILSEVERYLNDISTRDFHPSFTDDILHTLNSKINNFKSKDFTFTEEYKIDMALTACGYALRRFQEMVTRFREAHNPVKRFERDEKEKYLELFKNKYNQTTGEIAAG